MWLAGLLGANKMVTKVKTTCSMLFLCICGYGCTTPQAPDTDAIVEAIKENVPVGWILVESKGDEIPWGHLRQEGSEGRLLVLEGPADVNCYWRDHGGNWHETPLAKEALKLWIMAPNYRDSWKNFLNFHGPEPAMLIFSGALGRVYGYPTHRITSQEEFEELLGQATATSWPDSPHNGGALSWAKWKEDIERQLNKVSEK